MGGFNAVSLRSSTIFLLAKDWLQLIIDFSTKVAKLFANHIRRFLIFIGNNDPNGAVRWCVNYELGTHAAVIGKHLKDEHSVRPSNLSENFTILKKCRSKLECLIFEMLYIRKKRPKLNTQADSIRAKLFV